MATELVFNKDWEANTLFVMKVYDTDVTTLWKYFTEKDLLDQWWAPKPWKCETQQLEFKPGGTWIYLMIGSEGEKQMAGATYHEINFHRSFDWTDYFVDENGQKDNDLPTVKWLFGFTGVEEGVKLTINIHFNSHEDMKQLLEMGFEQGFTQGLNQLGETLSK